jgi:hypothetical protein
MIVIDELRLWRCISQCGNCEVPIRLSARIEGNISARSYCASICTIYWSDRSDSATRLRPWHLLLLQIYSTRSRFGALSVCFVQIGIIQPKGVNLDRGVLTGGFITLNTVRMANTVLGISHAFSLVPSLVGLAAKIMRISCTSSVHFTRLR